LILNGDEARVAGQGQSLYGCARREVRSAAHVPVIRPKGSGATRERNGRTIARIPVGDEREPIRDREIVDPMLPVLVLHRDGTGNDLAFSRGTRTALHQSQAGCVHRTRACRIGDQKCGEQQEPEHASEFPHDRLPSPLQFKHLPASIRPSKKTPPFGVLGLASG
jgi:hypothetical protein